MSTKIIATFDNIEREVRLVPSIEGLHKALASVFPCLSSHLTELELRYVDDEDDLICVTTNEEFSEALRVGALTGLLRLQIALPKHLQGKVHASPLPSAASAQTQSKTPSSDPTTATPGHCDALEVLQQAGATAISEVNKALGCASEEISKVFDELAAASKRRADKEAELSAAQADLESAQANRDQAQAEVEKLKEQVRAADVLLQESLTQKEADAQNIASLRAELAEASQWEAKFRAAEDERVKLEGQLQALRTGLLSLTGTSTSTSTSTKVIAEVVSNEPVPPSPGVEAELPPPYPESEGETRNPVVTSDDVFTTDEPALSPELQSAMTMVKNVGFSISKEELQTRYAAAKGNMEILLNSLLDA